MSFIAEAKSRHSLVEVAGRTGISVPPGPSRSLTVQCPFPAHGHPDRSPSLRLYLSDDYYCCLGCGSKGDVVQWARETEQVSVFAAIEMLDAGGPLTNAWAGHMPAQLIRRPAGAAGEVPRLDRTERAVVQSALDAAWGFYSSPSLHCRGVAYLSSREIDVSVIEAHTLRTEVGHTPASSDGLVTALRAQGFSDDELVDAGLATRRSSTGRISDFYRQRVLVPVRGDGSHVCGIVGRNVGDPRFPKYTNPPRTAVYDKSVNLYQPLLAPSDAGGRVIVVEGTLDAMAIAVAAIRTGQADRFCPVTQSGKELSANQLASVIGLHPNPPVLAFDGDAAGHDSNIRVAHAAAERGDKVLVTVLPADHDPASWLAEHGDDGLEALALGHCVEDDGAADESGPKRGDRCNRYAPLPAGMATSLLVDDGVLTGVIL